VRSLAESKTGAAISSVCAKMSETKIGLPNESGAEVRRETGMKLVPELSFSDCARKAICAKLFL
jgi:hypothetical protein